jgi:hypothetical protein
MYGDPMKEVIKAAHRFVNEMDLNHSSIGLMIVSDSVKMLCHPTQDGKKIREKIALFKCVSVDVNNPTEMASFDYAFFNANFHIFQEVGGGNEAQPFTDARKFFSNVDGIKFMLVLADGVWDNQSYAVAEAKKCHADEIEVAALGFGGADSEFLRDIASCEENAIFTNMNQLGESFSKIAQVITEGKTELQRRN